MFSTFYIDKIVLFYDHHFGFRQLEYRERLSYIGINYDIEGIITIAKDLFGFSLAGSLGMVAPNTKKSCIVECSNKT